MSIDWDNAPEGAEYYAEETGAHYPIWIKYKDGLAYGWLANRDTKWDQLIGFNSNRITHERPKPWSTTTTTAAKTTSNGLTADYYELPASATQLQDLISFKDMNAQVGESFRSL